MSNTCIKCKSDNITAEPATSEGDFAWIKISCNDCEEKWTEHYKLFNISRVL
jgi:hypothetical protein